MTDNGTYQEYRAAVDEMIRYCLGIHRIDPVAATLLVRKIRRVRDIEKELDREPSSR